MTRTKVPLDGGPTGYVRRIFDLERRVAVVTGVGHEVGAAIAIGLSQAGMRVAAFDIEDAAAARVRERIVAWGGECLALECDVASDSSLAWARRRVVEDLGAPHVAVHAASRTFHAPAEEFPEEEFDQIVSTNLKGTYLACQTFGRVMLRRGTGSIINVISIGNRAMGSPASADEVTEGAVRQLTAALASEWRERGVRVNAIVASFAGASKAFTGATALSDAADVEDTGLPQSDPRAARALVGTAVFLASDGAALVTGQTLRCDVGVPSALDLTHLGDRANIRSTD